MKKIVTAALLLGLLIYFVGCNNSPCQTCDGKGYNDCGGCSGKGQRPNPDPQGYPFKCFFCSGIGIVNCGDCKGRGR